MEQQLVDIVNEFDIVGDVIDIEPIRQGFINSTYKVLCNEGTNYVLQKINNYVFNDPVALMENSVGVTEYLADKYVSEGKDPFRNVLKFVPLKQGGYVYILDGGYWRLTEYIEDNVTYCLTEDMSVIEGTGEAFGRFQRGLADYDIDSLHITIKDFHNTTARYATFKQAILNDKVGRLKEIQADVDYLLSIEKYAEILDNLLKEKKVPLRVTHNDTKSNNVLFDSDTGKSLAVIDLDTVMPGLAMHDFGDAVRYLCNNTTEDDPNLDNVGIRMDKYEAFAKGFITTVGNALTPLEIETMTIGAFTMTVECAIRFASDYLDGDVYFRLVYPKHNLDRLRCQMKHAKSILEAYEQMQAIVEKYSGIKFAPERKHL